ncbi:hypothetical protein DL771_010094 [Monosporascus sp. 5C6A]|nr:hypothetical protein DL771_010094 [Monosporascus sp. 5C6A]
MSFVSGPSSISQVFSTDASWTPLGLGKDVLLPELEKFYWEGVRGELENIIRTLKIWQSPEFSSVSVADEEDSFIHGFDTFLDQVTEESRAFAIRYGKRKEKEQEQGQKNYYVEPIKYAAALEEVFKDRQADHASSKVRAGVRRVIDSLPRLQGLRQRAWMLLQAAVALSEFDKLWIPRLEPLHCVRPECKSVIRGSMFVSITNDLPSIICEDCYRSAYYGNGSFTKAYKHCILAEAITPPISRKICHCKDVPHFDGSGKALALFPVDKGARHLDVGGAGTIQCSLLKLGEIVALAKYNGLQSIVGTKKLGKPPSGPSKVTPEKETVSLSEGADPQKKSGWKPKRLKIKTESSLHDSANRVAASSSTSVATEPMADRDIPLFFRKFTTKYPFGNVHMALRVGPLVIENGVSHTKGGALVTLRELPVFQERFPLSTTRDRSLAVSGATTREIWQQHRSFKIHKRYKAVMKQIVGVPFTGVLGRDAEVEIVDDLLAASRRPFDDPGLPISDQQTLLANILDPVLEKLKSLIGSRVKAYLESIVERLLDPSTKLTWSATTNNCQSFCNSLINPKLFEPLVNGLPGSQSANDSPLYVMSFVCLDEGYLQRGVNTKYDVPSGLTEEYLLRFHFGRHDEADIIDTNQEYWYDWGAFGGPLYKYQDLFPWDCTEAYGRYPTRCGDCNLAKHIWAFPFDAWSMASLHLTRDPHMYAPAVVDTSITASGEGATPQSWMRNRLTVLAACATLSRAATAMAQTPRFAKATAWLHKNEGLRKAYPALARVKLGGIHRAQPFSHYFEAGTYSHYFLAEWALWSRPEQVAAYEELRDGRAKLWDVVHGTGGRFTSRVLDHDLRGFSGFEGVDTTAGTMLDTDAAAIDASWTQGDAGFTSGDVAPDMPDSGPACAGAAVEEEEEDAGAEEEDVAAEEEEEVVVVVVVVVEAES